ncbi:glycosyltransferase family 2 protein [Candidatus Daviesbacteria bacterium]|nr:glycosyltransferase family 2 protein [Candidatus Daviesbacteria bacterium]
MNRVSVAIATFNEEKNIVDCLESVRQLADEIVVVDGSSSDQTVELARRFTDKIIIKDNPQMFHINKNAAIDYCSGDWILQLDADERVSAALAAEIKKIAQEGSVYDGFWIKRRNFFLGRWMRKTGMYPDPVIRLFKNGTGRLPEKSVHEQIEIAGKVSALTNDLIHLADPNFSRYLLRSNRYTTLTAREFLQQEVGTGVWPIIKYLFFLPAARFLQLYVRHKGFADGFAGLVFSFFSGLHIATAYIKYWEAKHEGGAGHISLDEWA